MISGRTLHVPPCRLCGAVPAARIYAPPAFLARTLPPDEAAMALRCCEAEACRAEAERRYEARFGARHRPEAARYLATICPPEQLDMFGRTG